MKIEESTEEEAEKLEKYREGNERIMRRDARGRRTDKNTL